MIERLLSRNEWKFAGALRRADPTLATVWWMLLVIRGLLPALFAISIGELVAAARRGGDLTVAISMVGAIFLALQVIGPIHHTVGANLGSRMSAWLYDQLTTACISPPGIAHLENPKFTTDITAARDFDLGMSGPPLSVSMDFIASGLAEMLAGIGSVAIVAGFAWWAAIILAVAWFATHWLLRESGVWRDRNTDEVREAQRHADYAYKLAVEPPAAKEVRLFGLSDWIIERFQSRRRQLFELRRHATRLRERPVIWSVLLVLASNLVVFWSMYAAAAQGRLVLGRLVTFATAAVSTNLIAFGGLSWVLDGAAAPAAAVMRLRNIIPPAGALSAGHASAAGMPARQIRFRNVTFAYATSQAPVLSGFDLVIPAGSSMAIVGQNGTGKTTLAKLLCRLYDPQEGAIEIDGIDLRTFDVKSWRSRVAAVFQDFIRFQLPLRNNVAPAGAPDDVIHQALAEAGGSGLPDLDKVLARGYPGGTDLSGGLWQRVALARAIAAVRLGAGMVLLDEPTAQLDVRGEAEIFDRILTALRHTTTILISHRFSTVRRADRICVLEQGKVVELGTHDELMAAGGRYRTMFEVQASHFGEGVKEGEAAIDVLE